MNIPNYEIKKELGQGGMATVYLAEQTMLSRDVALKVLLPDMVNDQTFQNSFLSEGKIIANLEHPNIVRVYDVGITDDAIFYMAMEYFSGGTLKEKIQGGKLPLEEAVSILEQVGGGLAYAHEQGFIHRDIKPGNILFHANDRAVLSDFGIAKLQDTAGDLTQMGYVQGTLQYMSPEQATTTELDQRSDVYSLGLVFYEMLTGDRAFKADTTVQAIYQHTTAPPPHLPQEYAQYQPALNKALAKLPEQRFKTVTEFTQAISDPDLLVDDRTMVYTGGAVNDRDKTIHAIPEVGSKLVETHAKPRNKKPWVFGGIAAAVFAVASAGGVMQYQKIQQAKHLAKEEAKKQELKRIEEEKRLAEKRIATEAEVARLKHEKEQREKLQAEEEKRKRTIAKEKAEQKRKAEAKEKAALAARQAEKQRFADANKRRNEQAKRQQAKDDALREQRRREWEAAQARKQSQPKRAQNPSQGNNDVGKKFAEGAAGEIGRRVGGKFADKFGL